MRFVLLFSLVLSTPVVAQVYRWVDARGTVHYSNETPPPGIKAQKIDIDAQPGAPVTESAAATPKAPKGLDFASTCPSGAA